MRKIDEVADPKSCLNRALPHEWVFPLLGRDEAAPEAIHAWARERIRLGKNQPNDPQIQEAYACARAMRKQNDGGLEYNAPVKEKQHGE